MPAFIPAQASRLHRLVSHVGASRNIWHREGRGPIGRVTRDARPSPCFKSAKRAAGRRREAERAADGGARQAPTGWMRTRREVFRPSAPRHPRRMDAASYAGCANGSRESRTSRPHRSSALTELAGRAMPPPLSRASLSRRDAWRRTRPRTQSFDCGAGRGLSQAHFGTAGEVAYPPRKRGSRIERAKPNVSECRAASPAY